MSASRQDGGGQDPAVARAEELIDRWAHRVTSAARGAVSRVVEEAEDVWAEAKHVRHKDTEPAGRP